MGTLMMGTAAGYQFQQWLRARVRDKRCAPRLPESAEDVPTYQAAVRRLLEQAAGPTPEYAPLDAVIHQVKHADGYRVEAVSFNTFAGLRMTANAYVPDADGPVPGVLAVHGHYAHGRRDPTQQRRCAALAKMGYFVLSVDCFGAGERAVELPGAYHGSIDAAALWLVGRSLFGVQIHENVRACDYLVSRPEVDATRLAITGASGGGNQSLYSGAWDSRFKVVIPVVAVGAYHQVVATSNCMCETPYGLPGALEQSDILALIAPRSTLVLSAMADGINFRYEDARRQVEEASKVWQLLGAGEKIGFKALPIPHGYHPPMRETALGWLGRWLQDAPSDAPVAEPEVEVWDYGAISCYPQAKQSQVTTIRQFFDQERDKSEAFRSPGSQGFDDVGGAADASSSGATRTDEATRQSRLQQLLTVDLGGPIVPQTYYQRVRANGFGRIFSNESGLAVPLWAAQRDYETPLTRVLVHVGLHKDEGVDHRVARHALAEGWHVWAADLPGLGEAVLPHESGQTQLNALRACHMLGFTLAGLWVELVNQIVDISRNEGAGEVAVVATGPAATPLLIGSSLLRGVDRLIVERPLATFGQTEAFDTVHLPAMIPNLLDVGDIPELAAWRAPHPLTIVEPVDAAGHTLETVERETLFGQVRRRYEASEAAVAFRLMGSEEAGVRNIPWV